MSLHRFLDICYAMLVDEYQRIGMDLFAALDKVREYAANTPKEAQEIPEKNLAAANDAALNQLKTMLAGTGRF